MISVFFQHYCNIFSKLYFTSMLPFDIVQFGAGLSRANTMKKIS